MPAFIFEKIPAPPRTDPVPRPAVAAKRRGRFARLIDRLTELRLQSYSRRRTAKSEQRAAKNTGTR